MDLEQTRQENIQRLTPHIHAIASGEMIEALEPFAKAYLGMYYQLDNDIPPRQRVASLVSEELAAAIMQGMQAELLRGKVPTPQQIGQAHAEEGGLGLGHILLVAIEEYCQGDDQRVLGLRDEVVEALLCYQFLYASYQQPAWHRLILEQRGEQTVAALLQFWQPLIDAGQERLPGLQTLIRGGEYPHIAAPLSLRLLAVWSQCDFYTLRRLMQWALRMNQEESLLALARQRIEELAVAEIRRRVYWLATAYIQAPGQQAPALSAYIGRTKEKVLPLLDYVLALLQDPAITPHLSAMDLARLLRIIAPIFARNEGRGGLLDDNSTRVLWLFDRLGEYPASERREAIAWLQAVRVMNSYADILESLNP